MTQAYLKPLVALPALVMPVQGDEKSYLTPLRNPDYYTVRLEVELNAKRYTYQTPGVSDFLSRNVLTPKQAEQEAINLAQLEGYKVIRTISITLEEENERG